MKRILETFTNKQGMKYLVCGGASFVSDYAAYWLFSLFLHFQAATYAGLLCGLLVNFLLSKLWVFDSGKKMNGRETVSYALFTAIGFAFTGAGMQIGVDWLGQNDKAARFVVAVLLFILNYPLRKYIIFKKRGA